MSSDRRLVAEWIQEICQDVISHPRQRQYVLEIVQCLSRRYFDEMYETTPKSEYQLSAMACLYVVSCYAATKPIDLYTLQTICCHCYTSDTIVRAVYACVQWLSPALEPAPCEVMRQLTCDEVTVCDLVQQSGRTMVRKRIFHEGLPAYHAMVEVFVHSVLAQTTSLHIAQLLAVQCNLTQTDLYYEYAEYPVMALQDGDQLQKRRWVVGLLRGVQCLHQVGIAHRDLKPANLHMTIDGQCRILDVGSAGFGSARHTNPICTITHRSPEMLQAEVCQVDYEYDGRSLDMWSIGIMLAQLYGHWRPFGMIDAETSAREMLKRIQERTASIVRTMKRVLPPPQCDIIRRCLQMDPGERPCIGEMLTIFTE
jgi:hypothetical protein